MPKRCACYSYGGDIVNACRALQVLGLSSVATSVIGSIDERQVRAATHHQVSPEHLARALAAFAACAGELFGGAAAAQAEDQAKAAV